jgi:hypothetical protein
MPPKIDQFVPLVPTLPSAESREFQITVIPRGQHVQSFDSLQNGMPTAGDPAQPKKHGGPILSVQRDNGRITHIKIQCNCGQLIDVECIYRDMVKAEAPPRAPQAPAAAPPPKAAAPPKSASPPPKAQESSKAKAPPKAAKAKVAPKGKPSKGRK